jgi:hypothetical protein
MKFPTLALAVLAALAAGCSKKPPSDAEVLKEARRLLHASCKKSGAKLTNITPEQLERFCVCSADKGIAILGADGVRGLATRGEPSEAVHQKMREAGEACAETIR